MNTHFIISTHKKFNLRSWLLTQREKKHSNLCSECFYPKITSWLCCYLYITKFVVNISYYAEKLTFLFMTTEHVVYLIAADSSSTLGEDPYLNTGVCCFVGCSLVIRAKDSYLWYAKMRGFSHLLLRYSLTAHLTVEDILPSCLLSDIFGLIQFLELARSHCIPDV